MEIQTREFAIEDYDAAVELWKRVEGVEIAEGDDRQGVAQFLARNPGLSRVATDGSTMIGVAFCGKRWPARIHLSFGGRSELSGPGSG
jgi:N-acetylglutamate synthase